MTTQEILFIGHTLSLRRLKSKLWKQLRIERPTLAWGTVVRAFQEIAGETDSDLLPWIQEEGKKMVEADDLRIKIAQGLLNQLETDTENLQSVGTSKERAVAA